MARRKKLTGGPGWSLESSEEKPAPTRYSLPPAEQCAKVSLVKRNRGKKVTLISGLVLIPADLTALAKELKNHCGSGGTAKQGEIEIQGDHLEKVQVRLREKGFPI